MKNKRYRLRQTRGWYPNDPTLFISSRATHSRKLEKWIANPFATIGALMIVSSLLSAVFGATLISVYLVVPPPSGPGITEVTRFYSGLFIGIFSLAAFALGLYSGILLFARKHIIRAVICMAMILSCGVATVLAPIIEGLPSQSGLLVASPMIVSSIAALCVTGLNGFSQRTRAVILKQPTTIRERLFAGLAAAGGGLVGIGVFFYFAPIFPKQMVVIAALAIGVPLLVAAFLVRRTPKTNMVTME